MKAALINGFSQIREVIVSQDADSVDFLQDFKTQFSCRRNLCVYAERRCENVAGWCYRTGLCFCYS